jgi:acetyl-CoA C-acetyltransferase/potassium large conductance calcium-activated channel subfamily M alpha protein 1
MELTWLSQYAEGMGHEIYRIKLSKKMENRTFAEISGLVYMQNRSIVFAIEIKTNGKTIIRLNPSDFIVNNIDENQIYVYTICEDKDAAQEIETLYMSKDEINKYYNAKALADKIAKEEEDNAEEEVEDEDTLQEGSASNKFAQ